MTKPKVSAQHINPFIRACVETFRLMAELEVTPQKPELTLKKATTYDITGIIGLSGEVQGSINLCLKKEDTLSLVSKFIGAPITQMDRETADAIGEIANIIAGSAKRELKDFKIQISLPVIIMGANHLTDRPKGLVSFRIPFSSPLGNFDLVISLKN